MPETDGQQQQTGEKEAPAADQCILEIHQTLLCVKDNQVKTCSICRVPEKVRESKDKEEDKGKESFSYSPKLVAMGPIHRGTRSDLHIMEETKWRYMHKLLRRPTQNKLKLETVKIFSEAIKDIESTIRASYSEKIEMGAEELSRIMLLDACFLLEFLLRLSEEKADPPLDDKKNSKKKADPPPDDEKKILRLLTDLTLLENQIPFVVLMTLSSRLLRGHQEASQQLELSSLFALSQHKKISPTELAKSLFECHVDSAEISKGVYHFLHLIHLCSPDPYQQEDDVNNPLQLHRCARELQAYGITIKASQDKDHSEGNNNNNRGIVDSALTEFVDKFNFKIEFDEKNQELTIPTLHIKEATEVKWRNLIAWEQLGLDGIGYKFSSYAYFFKGLVCCVHDIQLLKEKGVIEVHNKEAIKDDDLLMMFKSITTGAEKMDARYRKECEKLNKPNVKGGVGCCVLRFRMAWHNLRRFLEWLQRRFISWIKSFIDIYLGTPWKFIGVIAGGALLAFTITQTVYARRAA